MLGLIVTGWVLALAGVGAILLGSAGYFLPHDIAFLGTSPYALCVVMGQCRLVHFMLHDRVAFGGVLVALGSMYLWLARGPIRDGAAWGWWALFVSAGLGFASFFAYIGYGYLDTWHGVVTLALLPFFAVGLVRTAPARARWQAIAQPFPHKGSARLGRWLLLLVGVGQLLAGVVIVAVGMTWVFVPQDLRYLGLTLDAMRAMNPHLVPLIAHDRAGFGGALASCGVLVAIIAWKLPERMTTPLWRTLAIAGCCGFGCAIGVHYPIGYVDMTHLAPAWAGALLFVVALVLLTPAERTL